MKYLFIIPNYHQVGDSTAIVSKEYVNYLIDKKEDVTVLCFDNYQSIRELVTIENDVKVINLVDERSRKSGSKSYFELNTVKKMTIKMSCYLKRVCKIKTNEWPLDAISDKKIMKHLESHYDFIISASSPFYSHVLASKLKKKGYSDKWIAMAWDPYVYNATMPNSLRSRKKAAEKSFKNVDKIYCSDGVIDGNIAFNYKPDYLNKCVTIKFPGLKEFANSKIIEHKEKNLLFIGSFYEDIRNPKVMFDILNLIPKEYKVNLYSKGCENIVNSLDERYQIFSQVSKEEVPGLIMSSNIVINLGNTVINQIPAKIFELISSGKPIINFYFSYKDPSLKYFNKRPLCYSFKLNDYSKDDIDGLVKFIKENDHKTLSFSEVIKDLKEYEHKEALTSFFEEITNK